MWTGKPRFKGHDHVSHKLHQHIRCMLGLTLKVLGCYCSCAIACYWYQMSHDHDGWLCVWNGSSHSCCERIGKLKNGLASYDACRGSHCGVTGMMVTKGNHPQMAWVISAIFGLVWITLIQQSGVGWVLATFPKPIGCLKHLDSSNFNNSGYPLTHRWWWWFPRIARQHNVRPCYDVSKSSNIPPRHDCWFYLFWRFIIVHHIYIYISISY